MSTCAMKNFRWLALVLIILGFAAMALGGFEQPEASQAMKSEKADSTTVALLQEKVTAESGDDSGKTALVLVTRDNGGEVNPQEVAGIAEKLGAPPIPNDDGTAILMPTTVESDSSAANGAAIKELRADLSDALPEGLTAQVTGPAAIQGDLALVFEGANFLLLTVTGIIVALLLIVTYRSPVLWIIPLLVIAIGDRVAATVFTWVLGPLGVIWDESSTGILSVLVFGAGTNYALLLISRYRDELLCHEDRFEAMAAAWLPTVKTVAASALTVAIGVACLLLSTVPSTRGLGLSSAIGIGVAFIFAMLVLPGVLVMFGRWIFWPKRPVIGEAPNHGVWEKIGSLVKSRPGITAAAASVLIGICCLGLIPVTTGINQSDQFIDTPESIIAADTLKEKFPNQSATPEVVATKDPQVLENLPGEVTPAGETDGWFLANVTGSDVQTLRAEVEGTETLVGGQNAQLLDNETYAQADRRLIFPVVLSLIFVALAFALRSLVAPAIMVTSVVATNVAALGLGWWISTGVFGFERFASETPLYAFVFLVALGIDYSIFLVTRARQEAVHQGTRDGIITALASTGGVITSAGILLASVFAALGVLPLVALAQVGIVIFVGVLLDTLVIRTILIPALVILLGDKFWWPSRIEGAEKV